MIRQDQQIVMLFASTGAYRLNALHAVKAHFGSKLLIISGNQAPDKEIRLVDQKDLDHSIIRNFFLPGNILIQNIPLRAVVGARIIVADLNPRLPQIWLLLLLSKIAPIKIILWGHAFPRAGKHSFTEHLRNNMRRMADGLITYTVTQQKELAEMHPNKPVSAAPNAIYLSRDFGFDSLATRNSFLYVGRMTAEKKPLLLIKAFELLAASNDSVNLVLAGDGPVLEEVRKYATRSSFRNRISILGHVADYKTIKLLYSSALASVSPGPAGLLITQSLGFGVPVIVSRNEKHGPEIEAAIQGSTALYFDENSVIDLATKMLAVETDRALWHKRGEQLSAACQGSYSAESMANSIINIIEKLGS